ncbi:MAG: hypothetical protein LBU27_02580, partial [Candidatus Peribacteria bacterium]|nr:hypothetical protein [Candidatus Peribacteria bacterium]
MLFVFCLLFPLSTTFAYTPTNADTNQLSDLKNTLNTVDNADLRNYYQQFAKLQKTLANRDERLDYLLANVRDWSYTQFTKRKENALQQSKTEKADFLR